MSETELYHHGVKGMKWGVRKQKQTTGTGKKRGRKRIKKEGLVNEIERERRRQNRHIAIKRAVSVGRAAANKYLERHDVTINGNPARVSSGAEALAKWGLDYNYMKDTFK